MIRGRLDYGGLESIFLAEKQTTRLRYWIRSVEGDSATHVGRAFRTDVKIFLVLYASRLAKHPSSTLKRGSQPCCKARPAVHVAPRGTITPARYAALNQRDAHRLPLVQTHSSAKPFVITKFTFDTAKKEKILCTALWGKFSSSSRIRLGWPPRKELGSR